MTASTTPSASPTITDQHVQFVRLEGQFRLISQGMTQITYIFLGLFAYLSIDSLAGKTTWAQIAVLLFENRDTLAWAPWLIALVAAGWGIGCQYRMRRTTESLQKRIVDLERVIDPNRTSSGLTTTGETPKALR